MYNNSIATLERIMGTLRSYTDATRVRYDVETLLRQIPSISPQNGVYTHNNGSTSTMLSLTGTIPIYYGGNQYNIPVEIWMPEAYPFAAPTCFVRPTTDMMIRPGHPHVDQNGLIVVPYSTNWDSDHSLVELVGYHCSIFGAQPPVFRRPANQPAPTPSYPPPPQQTQPQPSYGYQQGGYASPSQQPPQPSYQQPSQPYPSYAQPRAANQYSPYQPAVIDPVVKLKAEATEKIQHELQKIYKRIRDEIDDQFDTQRELSHGQQRLAHGQQSLEKLQADLTTAVAQVEAADAQVTDWLAANENQDEVGVDDVLVAADPLSQQQLDAYAERNAIEDALYFMDRALANGEIELPTFLKVRW
ncbi:hypothetical protein, variant [Aphanomyces astaci]|uniref:UEV domain-containing protein n=1 Tax=Aphanomyces astaci TaxID=112090 RepID=W4GS44_APHAT|nr:hypothetical protein, variant [Aphanomyces astaci]ETV82517.1 hypothetical protein, variant [Aphanomyces astaci]|eukprot:XP_009828186.1 hypothetical protein, variant [Aphanomyces astaci]